MNVLTIIINLYRIATGIEESIQNLDATIEDRVATVIENRSVPSRVARTVCKFKKLLI